MKENKWNFKKRCKISQGSSSRNIYLYLEYYNICLKHSPLSFDAKHGPWHSGIQRGLSWLKCTAEGDRTELSGRRRLIRRFWQESKQKWNMIERNEYIRSSELFYTSKKTFKKLLYDCCCLKCVNPEGHGSVSNEQSLKEFQVLFQTVWKSITYEIIETYPHNNISYLFFVVYRQCEQSNDCDAVKTKKKEKWERVMKIGKV